MVRVMRDSVVKFDFGKVVDIVGMGGDGSLIINVSMVLVLIFLVFMRVVKYGNVFIILKSGLVNVFEVFGLNIWVFLERVREMVESMNFMFIFVFVYYLVFRLIMFVRKVFGIKIVFNVIGLFVNLVDLVY